mmetsp:Transcript_1853/g.5445  ORF Transcript_1853/g.5445 Transcript_1853/m.5445 type:complete len:260 (-) Transcript_1853:19-798(-)
MPFIRDHGTCCLVFPLKLGVGVITMLVFAHSILCMLALVTGDIRFQPNGYNEAFYRLPALCGAVGLVVGFVGLLGTYDDNVSQLWLFNRYLVVLILCKLAAMIADGLALYRCEDWAKHHKPEENRQLYALSSQEVCPWARTSYLVGCIIDMAAWIYVAARCFAYEYEIAHNPPYKIDFGREKYDIDARWQFYKVRDPRFDIQESVRLQEMENQEERSPLFYGSLPSPPQSTGSLGYGPDGMPGPRPDLLADSDLAAAPS